MHGRLNPFSIEQLQEILDDFLGLVLSERRTVAVPVSVLARYNRQQQEWMFEWVKTLSHENIELAYQFTHYAPQALALMAESGLEDWIAETVALYDNQGLTAAIAHLQAVETYAQTYQRRATSLFLEDIQGVLQTFLTGLEGRQLKLAPSEITFTDTETLFLPKALNRFIQKEQNFFLYKAMAVHLWAQIGFGTWRRRLSVALASFNHRDKAIRLFHTLERLRLDACIHRKLPGLYRDMGHLLALFGEKRVPMGWEAIAQDLAQPETTVERSYQLLETICTWSVPAPVCYQGLLQPDCVEPKITARQNQDKQAFQTALGQIFQQTQPLSMDTQSQATQHSDLENNQSGDSPNVPQSSIAQNSSQLTTDLNFQIESTAEATHSSSASPILTLDGPILASTALKKVMASIVRDNGTIPEDYFLLLGHSEGYELPDEAQKFPSFEPKPAMASTVFLYPEWDYRRQRYYKNWCTLREVVLPLQSESFVEETLQGYRGLLKNLRRTFEALRGGEQRLKKQTFGDDIDLEALITGYADVQSGLEMTPQIFTKRQPIARDVAVIFMVDMSGSTKGWINQAERESLILLCEVLDTLGDQYAIYGFSGMTRKRCEIYPIKRFEETYNRVVQQRLCGISPQEYTRMGVAIRHLITIFQRQAAKIKLLITLSDGKPDDEGDNYRGIYGIEDTRQALLEAKQEGIHPFCITIDTAAQDYLPRMYGAVNYTVIYQVTQLPLKVSDIYRKLTT